MAVPAPAPAAPGALDPTFSNDGIRELEFGERDSTEHPAVGVSIAPIGVDGSGQLVLAGETFYVQSCFGHLGCLYNGVPTLARLNPDGSLDTSFSGDGKLETDLGEADARVTGWALQQDGKVVAAEPGPGAVRIARLTRDGELDPAFAGGAWASIPVPETANIPGAVRIALQSDGRAVVAVVTEVAGSNGRGWTLNLLRLEADGTQDPSFGAGGLRKVPLGDDLYATLVALKVDGSDRIYVSTGQDESEPGNPAARTVFSRFGSDGAVDAGYGNAGSTAVPTPNLALTDPDTMALDDAGRLYGLLPAPLDQPFGANDVVRLDASGQPDGSYGPNGVRPAAGRPAETHIEGVSVQSGSKPLLAGSGPGGRLILGRQLAGGDPDPVFGPGGWVASVTAVAGLSNANPLVPPSDRIVIAAQGAFTRGPCAVVARYQADAEPAAAGTPDPVPCSDPCKPIHGCPLHPRSLSIHHRGRRTITGRLSSDAPQCVSGATVEVYRRRHERGSVLIGTDELATDGSASSARYKVTHRPRAHGRVFAKVEQLFDPSLGTCATGRSETMRLPKPDRRR